MTDGPNERVVVLLVEDDPEDLERIRAAFARATWLHLMLEVVTGLSAAMARLERGGVDAVMLDLWLSDSRGLATFTTIHERWPDLPIMVLSGEGEEQTAIAAMRAGAQDHLVKDRIDAEGLSRAIRYAVERRRMQREIRSLVTVDGLTGLYNLRGFVPLAEHHLKLAHRTANPVTLLFIDLDGLEAVNQTWGRGEGSRMLVDAAKALQEAVRDSDVLARLGGDEFCVLLTGDSAGAAPRILTRLVEAIAVHKALSQKPYTLSLSVGAATYDPEHPCTLEELLQRADAKMREDKRRKRASP